MKTCRQVTVTLFYLILFLLVILVYPVSVAWGEQQEESNQWWPSTVINPPELEAFFRVLDENSKGVYILPKTKNDPRVALIEPELNAVLNTKGKLTGLTISIMVTKHITNRDVYRQFSYHDIWTSGITDLFYDMSFLNRTVQENRKLAFSDEEAYWDLVEKSIPNIKQKAVEDALAACRKFATSAAKGLRTTALAHQALDEFADRVDAVFRQAFEPFIGVRPLDPKKLILVFDYDPRHENAFILEALLFMRLPAPFELFIPYEKLQQIARVSGDSADQKNSPASFAKQAFRVLSELLAGEKR